jgi:hypothetical protein
VRLCSKGPFGYALYDGTNVMKLSDQKAPVKSAAQKVKVMVSSGAPAASGTDPGQTAPRSLL